MAGVRTRGRRSAWVLPGSRRVRSGTPAPGFAESRTLSNPVGEAGAVAWVDLPNRGPLHAPHRGPLHATVLYLVEQGAVRSALQVLERRSAGLALGDSVPRRCEISEGELLRLVRARLDDCWRFLVTCEEGLDERFAPIREPEVAIDPTAPRREEDSEPAVRGRDRARERWTSEVLEGLRLRMIGRFEFGCVSVRIHAGECSWTITRTSREETASTTEIDSPGSAASVVPVSFGPPDQGDLPTADAGASWYHEHFEIPPRVDHLAADAVHVAAVSLPGVTHVLGGGTACQDASWVAAYPGGLRVLAVSDGHGSSRYVNSDVGARLAVSVVHELLPRIFGQDLENSHRRLRASANHLRPSVVNEWNRRVRLHDAIFGTSEPIDDDALRRVDGGHDDAVRAYGATILGVAVKDGWMVSMQLGDGDIVRVSHEGERACCERVFVGQDKRIDSATASLASKDAATPENFQIEVKRFDVAHEDVATRGEHGVAGEAEAEQRPEAALRLVLLATDGVSDPYIPADADARAAGREEVFPVVWGGRVLEEIDTQGGFERWARRIAETVARVGEVSGDDVSIAACWWPSRAPTPTLRPAEATQPSRVDPDKTSLSGDGAEPGLDRASPVATDARALDAATPVTSATPLADWLVNEEAEHRSTAWEPWSSSVTARLMRAERGDIVLALGWDAPRVRCSATFDGEPHELVDGVHVATACDGEVPDPVASEPPEEA